MSNKTDRIIKPYKGWIISNTASGKFTIAEQASQHTVNEHFDSYEAACQYIDGNAGVTIG